MLISLTGLSRKEVAGIIGECLEAKPDYKGGITYQYYIGNWAVFMDSKVEPERADVKLAMSIRLAFVSQTANLNPKFTFRVFLIRLDMVGDEYKIARKILLEKFGR
jgi:hypothetical protein